MPIRVLCVFSTLDRGGSESMCMNLYRNIDREKIQFDFVKHTDEKGEYEDEISSLGGRIYEAPRYLMTNHFQYGKWWKQFLQEHPEHKIIHGHFFTISAVYFRIAKKYGRITIGHSHCTPSGVKSVKNRLLLFLISKIEKYSDYCFACSELAGRWLFPNKTFKVLNNAIDSTRFKFNATVRDEVRKEMKLEDDFVVGTVGRIMYQKNPLGIVDIFKAIHDRKDNAKLLWIGNGPMRTDAEKRIQEYGLQDSVIMTGVRSDVQRLMQAMDVFILPSFYEGLPVVAIEAQTSGLHCFCSDTVTHEAKITERCYFLPLNDPERWADEILSTTCDHIDTQKDIVAAGYDIHQTAQWLSDFYIMIGDENGTNYGPQNI